MIYLVEVRVLDANAVLAARFDGVLAHILGVDLGIKGFKQIRFWLLNPDVW